MTLTDLAQKYLDKYNVKWSTKHKRWGEIPRIELIEAVIREMAHIDFLVDTIRLLKKGD